MFTTASGNKATEPSESFGAAESSGVFRWDLVDVGIVVAAVVATFLVHPIHDMLTQPYWLDEAWVAVLTRLPWSRITGMSSSTPVGFLALLKLVPGAWCSRTYSRADCVGHRSGAPGLPARLPRSSRCSLPSRCCATT